MALSIRKYKKGECVTFKSTKGNHGGLSNMAPNFTLYVNDTKILTAEALYQCLRFPNHPNIQEELIKFTSPISAKRFGRTFINLTRTDWNQHRFSIMKFCLEVKLYQNYQTFSALLLQTKDLPIVEFTDKDKVWGATLEGDYYTGTNALGRLLMELREKVKNDNFKITVPPIPEFFFLGNEITLTSLSKDSNKNIL